LPEDLPLLHFDAVLLERVLVNLLENAAKYTPAESPIAIGAASDADAVHVWVDDLGPGLPPGMEDRIFDRFTRGERETSRPGTGLGLAFAVPSSRPMVGTSGRRIVPVAGPASPSPSRSSSHRPCRTFLSRRRPT